MKLKFLEIIRNQFVIFACLIAIFTTLGFLGQYFFLFDIMSQFRLQYLIFGIIIFFGLLLWNKLMKIPKWALCACLLIIIINFFQVLPWLKFNKQEQYFSKNEIKIELINVLTSNYGYNAVLENIKEFKPNVVFLEEVNDEWLKNMKVLDKIYPYSIKHPRDDNFGVALYSNIPIKTKEIKYFGHFGIPVIDCTINLQNQKIKIIGIHTTPPSNQEYFINRDEMLSELANFIKNNKMQTIVIGDLNMTMYSPSFKKFIKNSQLLNPRTKFGINPTWSPKSREINGVTFDKFFKFAMIPIDQVLHTSNIKVNSFKTGKSIGSDHLPVLVSIENGHK